MVDIRNATPEDAVSLADIYLESARYHAALDPKRYWVPDSGRVTGQFADDLRAGRAIALGARRDGVDAGFVTITVVAPSDRASMVRPRVIADIGLAVRAEFRRQGIGRVLMLAAEAWAAASQVAEMTLDCHASNEAAIGLYRSLGYETMGLFMSKALEPAASVDGPS